MSLVPSMADGPSTNPTWDAVVVGAGPAGSACAQRLAEAGWRVALADQHAFPRDKVCGDGLIPDAHSAFEALGVAQAVHAAWHRVGHVRTVAPRGGHVDVPGRLAVLPRRVLDEILRSAAVKAGAQWFAQHRLDALQRDANGRVIGARFKTPQGPTALDARWVVLATGATPQALISSDVCTRRAPSGMALRGYLQSPEHGSGGAALGGPHAAEHTTMDIVWHRSLGRGYGWIFPCGQGLFNVGVGLSDSHVPGAPGAVDDRAVMANVNLRELFETFCRVHPPARALVARGQWASPLKGAPLRCSLTGARPGMPGLLVTGEAVGSTYAFTGEGIGKAMETGMLAAHALLAHPAGAEDGACVAQYGQALADLQPRFDLYARADRVHDFPWLIDLLVWRAKRSPAILARMSNVIEERSAPGHLVSVRGVARLLWPRLR
jgi:menaquinone-9 beta-reductase